jgi:predicted DCC family thiol-disulfide oxidoreductase YuxK
MYTLTKLTVLFDEACPFCLRVVAGLKRQDSYFALEFLPMRQATSSGNFRQFAGLVKAGRFVAIADNGAVYLDTKARLMIIYALKKYRAYAFTLAGPELYRLVDLAFEGISRGRGLLAPLYDRKASAQLQELLCQDKDGVSLTCKDGRCEIT